MNGATCFDTVATEEGFACRCAEGFYGNHCENHVMTETVQPSVMVVTHTQNVTFTMTQTQTQNQTFIGNYNTDRSEYCSVLSFIYC